MVLRVRDTSPDVAQKVLSDRLWVPLLYSIYLPSLLPSTGQGWTRPGRPGRYPGPATTIPNYGARHGGRARGRKRGEDRDGRPGYETPAMAIARVMKRA